MRNSIIVSISELCSLVQDARRTGKQYDKLSIIDTFDDDCGEPVSRLQASRLFACLIHLVLIILTPLIDAFIYEERHFCASPFSFKFRSFNIHHSS